MPLMRIRGPANKPESIALRTAVSAEPAPSVPMSRSAVNPAIRSCFAASIAISVRCGTLSCTVCRSSAPTCRNRCTCASIQPRHQGDIAQVDDLRAGGSHAARRGNAIARDDQQTRLQRSCPPAHRAFAQPATRPFLQALRSLHSVPARPQASSTPPG